ncbi:hypothetical protein [Mycolicibacterium sp.]|uniref:hypothetical protein n=1 Tax=Mycolicibacterium sp. TaxID=2320850 RepID=UPI0037C943CD
MLGSDPGQGLNPEFGELLDCRVSLDKSGFQLFDFCFEAFDLLAKESLAPAKLRVVS